MPVGSGVSNQLGYLIAVVVPLAISVMTLHRKLNREVLLSFMIRVASQNFLWKRFNSFWWRSHLRHVPCTYLCMGVLRPWASRRIVVGSCWIVEKTRLSRLRGHLCFCRLRKFATDSWQLMRMLSKSWFSPKMAAWTRPYAFSLCFYLTLLMSTFSRISWKDKLLLVYVHRWYHMPIQNRIKPQ